MVCFICELLTLMFFFFKQKTAYDIRISDWSSDVCSSDLQCRQLALDDPVTAALLDHCARTGRGFRIIDRFDRPARDAGGDPDTDRKSVVQGKSVSDRVALGGRRIMKKTTTTPL